MKIKIVKLAKEESIIEVETKSEVKQINITTNSFGGHSYNDFADWDISDRQYYKLEEIVDGVLKIMSNTSSITFG